MKWMQILFFQIWKGLSLLMTNLFKKANPLTLKNDEIC